MHGPIAPSVVRQAPSVFVGTAASKSAMRLVNGRRVWVRAPAREVRSNYAVNADNGNVGMTVNGSANATMEMAPPSVNAEIVVGSFAVLKETGVHAKVVSRTDAAPSPVVQTASARNRERVGLRPVGLSRPNSKGRRGSSRIDTERGPSQPRG